jgi:hypothetical protein
MINKTHIDNTERVGIIVQIGYPPSQIEWRHDPQSGFVQVSFMEKTKTKRRTAFDAREGYRITVSQMVIIKLYYLNREINYLWQSLS